MTYVLDDTIAAIASPAGGAARGIIRLSGPEAIGCLDRLFLPDGGSPLVAPDHPTAVGGALRLEGLASLLPARVYCWPERRSYTGQTVAEIHTLGSPPLVEAALAAVCRAGARVAEPGEFTLRAFLAGRIDLTQAEAVLGVIDAGDRRQLDVALGQLAGGLARPLAKLRGELVSLLADLEAGLDFPEEDITFIDATRLGAGLAEAGASVDRLLAQMESRTQPDHAARVVLLGAPNAGKSSLFNALAGRAGALVSDEPGTTRDWLVAAIDLDGLRCRLVDTAGVHEEAPAHEIAVAAQEATTEQAAEAHLRVFCIDSTSPLSDWDRDQLARDDPRRIVVLTKTDAAADLVRPPGAILTSSRTGAGLDLLRARLREALLARPGEELGVVAGTAARCRQSLELSSQCLSRAGRLLASGEGEELIAAELRTALAELGKVVGEVYTDEILDLVFSRFCVGK